MGSACCLALNTPYLRLLQSRGVESGAWVPFELAANCRWLRAAGWLQAEAGLELAPSLPLHTVLPELEDFPTQPLHKSRRFVDLYKGILSVSHAQNFEKMSCALRLSGYRVFDGTFFQIAENKGPEEQMVAEMKALPLWSSVPVFRLR